MSITFNKKIIAADVIEKTFGSAQSYSKIAITIMDFTQPRLEISMKFETSFELENAFSHMLGIWQRYQPIKSFIRTFKMPKGFLEEFNGYKLKDKVEFPSSEDHFYYEKNKALDYIIDIEQIDDDKRYSYVVKFYRWREDIPRALVFALTDDALIETKTTN